jgi:hypothetical protein
LFGDPVIDELVDFLRVRVCVGVSTTRAVQGLFQSTYKVLGVACAGVLLKNGDDQEDRDGDLDESAAGVVLVRGPDIARNDM